LDIGQPAVTLFVEARMPYVLLEANVGCAIKQTPQIRVLFVHIQLLVTAVVRLIYKLQKFSTFVWKSWT